MHALEGHRIVVERADLRLWVDLSDVVASAGADVRPGDTCAVRLPKELLKLSPGFYMALGDNGLTLTEDANLVRFYWNVSHQGAARLVGAMTKALNEAGLAFRLKVLDETDRFGRCDAGVLYVQQSDFARVAGPVRACHAEIADVLDPRTPAFTKKLAPGLAIAEEPPGSTESFGMHRCRLVAEAVLQAGEGPGTSVQRRLEAVSTRFDEDGLCLAKPFLNPGSADAYDLDVMAVA